jgi:hypothetical protein
VHHAATVSRKSVAPTASSRIPEAGALDCGAAQVRGQDSAVDCLLDGRAAVTVRMCRTSRSDLAASRRGAFSQETRRPREPLTKPEGTVRWIFAGFTSQSS